MKFALLLFSLTLGSASLSQSATLDHCCACIVDDFEHVDKKVIQECKDWLKQEDSTEGCDLSVTYELGTPETVSPQSQTCSKVTIYGAFHGRSDFSSAPFSIAKSLAHAFHASTVIYDGSSCLVFDNIDQIKIEAKRLASSDKQIDYQISGNQNLGVVSRVPIFGSTHELKSKSSKANLSISGGKYNLTFETCSEPGASCAYAHFNTGSTNDPNAKWCTLGSQPVPVSQKCCTSRVHGPEVLPGTWQEPGRDCDSSPSYHN